MLNYLKIMKVNNWIKIVQNKNEWKRVREGQNSRSRVVEPAEEDIMSGDLISKSYPMFVLSICICCFLFHIIELNFLLV